MEKGFHVDSLQIQNFLSVGNVLQTINFENGNMRIVTGEDLGSTTLKRSGIGKAQPLYAKVRVKDGWKRIGDLGVGDTVVTPKGTETLVTGTYPQGTKRVFTITFEDGRKVEACKEHLWQVYTKKEGWNVIDTQAVVGHMKNDEGVYLPLISDDADSDADLPYSPYLLALCLINGEIDDSGYINLTVFNEEIQECVEYSLRHYDDVSVIPNDDGIMLFDEDNVIGANIQSFLYDSDIVEYMVNECSFNQRKEFLSAIFDLYASEDDRGNLVCIFSDEEKRLSELTQRLVWSLGGIDKVKKSVVSDELFNIEEEYNHTIQLRHPNSFFKVLYKRTFEDRKFLLKVRSINFKKETPCVCISILSDDKLYVTDNHIVTHNTTVPNALAYAFYGKPVAKIKTSLLPNTTNKKNMFVRVNFRKDGKQYFIERGAKPDIFRFVEITNDGEKERNDTQGTKADTQVEIEKIIGMSLDLFTMIVTINTINDCFMKKPLSKQRDIIEEILNISELTRKAKILSDYRIKESKSEIDKEKVRIESQKTMKQRAEQQLAHAKRQYEQWNTSHKNKVIDLYTRLEQYQNIDIEEEIANHKHNEIVQENTRKKREITTELNGTQQLVHQGTKRLTEINSMLDSFSTNTCPTCKQTIEDDSRRAKEGQLIQEAKEYFTVLEDGEGKVAELKEQRDAITVEELKPVSYRNINDAYNHQHAMNNISENIDNAEKEVNPHTETITNSEQLLNDSEVEYGELERLEEVLKHQVFLQKMLTGRDSFIRKRIIDISLPVLNQNIERYLRRTNIRHEMKFMSDLTLEIYKAGNEYDFDQLSRGEQNWAIIALNLAMRDLYEDLSGAMNIIVVDELIDFGVDLGQSIDAFNILKEMTRERKKSVSLITHREELFEKADDILYTLMENDFTSYEVRTN